MTTTAAPRPRNTIASTDRGRAFNAPRDWIVMNRKHFHWLVTVWWESGYEAGVRAAQEKAGQA